MTDAALGGAADATPLAAQVSPQHAAEELQRNAALVRQRIRQSGLNPDDIRSRLQWARYPSDLLDPYVGRRPRGAGQSRL